MRSSAPTQRVRKGWVAVRLRLAFIGNANQGSLQQRARAGEKRLRSLRRSAGAGSEQANDQADGGTLARHIVLHIGVERFEARVDVRRKTDEERAAMSGGEGVERGEPLQR